MKRCPTAASLVLALALSTPAGADSAPGAYADPARAPASQPQDGWVIDLKGVDIHRLIEQIAAITGQTFIVAPEVAGQVDVSSARPLQRAEVQQLFLSVLASQGLSVISQGDQAQIISTTASRTAANMRADAPAQLATRLIPVQHGSASELLPLLTPLINPYGHVTAVASANALIISDRIANIERIEALVQQLDQRLRADAVIVDLQHAWAVDAAATLSSLSHGAQGPSAVQIIADAGTNRLILLGPPDARAKLADLARSLDSPSSRSANTRVIRLRHNNAKSLAETLGDISEGLKNKEGSETTGRQSNILIRADESLNALVLLAEPDLVATLEDIVRQLDVPRAQVMVEAAIVEVSGDITDAVGVQWAVDARSNTGGLGGVNFGGTGLSVGTVLQILQSGEIPENTTLPDGAIIGIGSDRFGALITALSANSKSNLLSTPSLLTLDNQKAEILVGQNVPFQTGSYTTDASGAGNPFTTIERKDIGVTLKVTPSINEGATLRLEIEQEISSIAPSTGLNAQAVDLVTNKRSIKSTILADDGQVIVLGGLIQDDVTQSISKVPLLGDIPLIGGLFRSTRDSHVKRNLMVFLRPTVVRDGAGRALPSASASAR
ncbi:type II secretion system secretin GspD [Pseudomonas sp.]|uniref:type II secretion system secretin GspD n=1 Tax=Ectopseudomonas guguanensis TaxID=1198456 RepID=UPI0012D5FA15|nr:type II secretion system secretin GspD [Pseudomonas sp.]MPT18582.1 type II secretion system protein GspD [Pseudomonas sp.]WJH59434.1 type II secretion system protein GspD [Pseudomonas guguanensis]